MQVHAWEAGRRRDLRDDLVVEEPCEIRLAGESVAVVMRTPGQDHELAAGFLYTEGIVGPGDIGTIRACTDPDVLNPENTVDVTLVPGRQPRRGWQRNFYAGSSCGICGKASIDAIRVTASPIQDATVFGRDAILRCLRRLRTQQRVFDLTGGLHAAGLFGRDCEPVAVREDIGRHNAVDKAIGHCFLRGWLPLGGRLLAVSGRSSFEIVQKALVAGVPILASVSAASSLAVELAAENNMTLIGFVREDRLIVYTGGERIAAGDETRDR